MQELLAPRTIRPGLRPLSIFLMRDIRARTRKNDPRHQRLFKWQLPSSCTLGSTRPGRRARGSRVPLQHIELSECQITHPGGQRILSCQ